MDTHGYRRICGFNTPNRKGDGRSGVVSAENSRGAASNSSNAGEDGEGDVPTAPDVARDAVRTHAYTARPPTTGSSYEASQRLKLNEAVEKVISKKIDKLEGM
eukprot:1180446-Prorocentrum_minimum.AAC.3